MGLGGELTPLDESFAALAPDDLRQPLFGARALLGAEFDHGSRLPPSWGASLHPSEPSSARRPSTNGGGRAPPPSISFSTLTTRNSKTGGRSASSDATASGEASTTPPSRGISTAGSSSRASPAPFVRSVVSSSSSPSPVKAGASAHRVGRSEPPSSPHYSRKGFSPTSLMPNGFSLCPRCCESTFSFIESFSACPP